MIEIRWHGRGGQGAKTAALLLADVAFNTGNVCKNVESAHDFDCFCKEFLNSGFIGDVAVEICCFSGYAFLCFCFCFGGFAAFIVNVAENDLCACTNISSYTTCSNAAAAAGYDYFFAFKFHLLFPPFAL